MACCMAGMQCVSLPSSISNPFSKQLTCQIQLLLLSFSSSSSSSSNCCCCLWAGSCAGVDRVLKYYRASRFFRICWGISLFECQKQYAQLPDSLDRLEITTTTTNAGAFRFRGNIKAISSWSVASHNAAREKKRSKQEKRNEKTWNWD